MAAFTATIAVLLAALAALFAVPVAVSIDARRVDRIEAHWRIRWLFGLVDVRSSKRDVKEAARDAPPQRSPRPRRRSTGGGRRTLAALRTRGLIHRSGRLLTAAVRQVKIERFHLEMLFGFDNPADTGFVYGCLSPVLVMAGVRGLDVQCQPMFADSGLTGVFQATVRFRPLFIIGTMVAFLVSPPVVRAAVAAWRERT